MKNFILLGTLLLSSLFLVGQSPGSLGFTHEEFLDWESEVLYKAMEDHYLDLNNTPNIRLQYAEIAMDRAREDDDPAWASNFATKIAVVYAELGMNQQAAQSGLEALNFARKTSILSDDIWSLLRLSDIHAILQDKERALQEAYESLQLAMEVDTAYLIGWSYNALGEAFRQFKDLDSAIYYYQEGLRTFQESNDEKGVLFMHQNIALTYTAMGEYDRALEEFRLADSIGREPDVLFLLEKGVAMMEIISARASLDSAISYGKKMMHIARKAEYPTWEKEYKARLADLHRANSDWDTAWQYHLEADSLEEIQTGERIRMQTSVAEHQYRMELLQTEHELQTQENRNQILLWISILIFAGLLIVVAMIQITKNKRIRRINEQLSRQNEHLDVLIKEKDIWINLMAHDLKAPLSAISGLLEMLQEDDLPGPVKDKVISNISKSVGKGSELISQLLEISRLESNPEKADIRPTNLTDLVSETETIFRPTAEKKGIAIEAEMPVEPVRLRTDPVYTQRILENFVSNAIKFSPHGKKVQLVLEPHPETVAIHVIDEGPGMSVEDQQNLFQKFRKLSAQPTGGESSTGLGLSIVKHLADRIDAEIRVNSKLGEGATFTLSIPRKIGPEEAN